MADLIASTLGPRIRLDVDVEPDLPPVCADQNQLEMALLNLSVNARDAMADGGDLHIGARLEQVRGRHHSGLGEGAYVLLSVADTGKGMDEATLARAIEPFFSTKGLGQGTGLGLSMVHGLAAQLGGALTLRSSPGSGTTVELWLPLSNVPAEEKVEGGTERHAAAAGLALVVDDEDLVRASIASMLDELGYSVIEVKSAEEALSELRKGLAPTVVVTDHLMPHMTGTELAGILAQEQPSLPVLIISGYAEDAGIAAHFPRLTKPFRQAELVAKLAEVVRA
jgi:CheY-like chemotaxis protein